MLRVCTRFVIFQLYSILESTVEMQQLAHGQIRLWFSSSFAIFTTLTSKVQYTSEHGRKTWISCLLQISFERDYFYGLAIILCYETRNVRFIHPHIDTHTLTNTHTRLKHTHTQGGLRRAGLTEGSINTSYTHTHD